MNQPCYIHGLGCYIPEDVLTNADLETMMDTSDEWIRSRTGIGQRHILPADWDCSDGALVAAKAALVDAAVKPEELTHIFVATCTPDHLCPSVACHLAGKLGLTAGMLHKDAEGASSLPLMAYDLNAACTGFLYGLEMSRAFLSLHPGSVILLVASEALSRRMDYSDRSTSVLFGDGAGAVVLKSVPPAKKSQGFGARVLDVSCGTDGSLHDLIVMGGGTAMRVQVGDTVPKEFFLSMKGREVFKYAVRSMTAESLALLQSHGLCVENMDLVIAHQANLRIIEAVGERLDVKPEQVFTNVENFGNTSAASILLALGDAREQGCIRPGMKVLLTSVGSGLTWASALLEI